MYAIIENKKIEISVAQYYSSLWYGKNGLLSHEEKFEFDYGHLEIDVHKGGKKY